jgi:hypothetical protein
MFKTFVGGNMELAKKLMIYSLIVTLFALLCTQLESSRKTSTHISQFNNLYDVSNTPYPVQNFLYLDTYLAVTAKNGVEAGQTLNSASGIAVKGSLNKVYAFTAGHWCSADDESYLSVIKTMALINPDNTYKIEKRVAFYGEFYYIEEIFSDMVNDICVITFSSPYAYKVKKIKPSSRYPEIGEEVFTSSSPLGMFSHTLRLIFSGRFSGCDQNLKYCFYTIPGVQGSSGSGVLNKKGELVSILDVSVIDFHQITGGTRLEIVKEMYDKHVR